MSAFLRKVYLAVKQQVRNCPVRVRRAGQAECRSYLRYVALVVILAGFSVGVRAQDVASITGAVTDKTGGTVSDASVKLANTRTGAEYESKTGALGAFLFARV